MGPTADLVDVAALAQLEKSARTFLETLEAAGPAYDRLRAVEYPGIGYVHCWDNGLPEELGHLIEALEDLRLANGDHGAADYFFFFKRLGAKSIADAATELIGCYGDVSRVEPMRRYAESVA